MDRWRISAVSQGEPSRRSLLNRRVVLKCLAGAVFGFAVVAAAGAAPQSATVVSGLVKIGSVDTQGNILSIEILVGDNEATGEPYLVVDRGKGIELRKHVGQWIIAGGIVTEDALGWKTIEVKTFTLEDDLQEK
jgi:hypothetical protein